MEIRKVQISGGSSFIISLPKEWAIKNGIKKNDKVGVIEARDGSLVIIPKFKGKERTIEIDAEGDENYIFRLLLASYIDGYNIIRLRAKEINSFIRNVVKKFIKCSIGCEVIEEDRHSIVIKDFLSPSDLPFEKIIKRIVSVVESMHEDLIYAIRSNEKRILEDIISRDDDVDKLHWLVSRQYNILSRNIFGEEVFTNYPLLSRILERCADHACKIAEGIKNFNKISSSLEEKISSAELFALKIFKLSIKSFFDKDLKKANECIEMAKKINEKCAKINNEAIGKDAKSIIYIGQISDSIRRFSEYSADIAEYVTDYVIGLKE
ncbi:MAG: AbrB/MazE/SpoVT family DNA-binding domain-containing protein [Thermoplasmatales archaeon]|nr:AbrB/MazE/SpoVT family DNA-binding domain-containing protein [Thermoplasmatales archaeon]